MYFNCETDNCLMHHLASFGPEVSAKLFQSQFIGYGWTNQSIYYMVFCRQKLPNKDLSWSKSEKVYTRLYMNKLESIMRALSDAFPTGHRAMANHSAPTGARNSSLGHPNMAEASLGKNFPKMIPSLLRVFNG